MGTLLTFEPGAALPTCQTVAQVPGLKMLQALVGGPLQLVPYFTTIDWSGEVHSCIAYCHEEGKNIGLPLNPLAQDRWLDSTGRHFGTRTTMGDFLVGPVVVLFGDDDFMAAQ